MSPSPPFLLFLFCFCISEVLFPLENDVFVLVFKNVMLAVVYFFCGKITIHCHTYETKILYV